MGKGGAMKVTILNISPGHICTCGSWLEHWNKFSKFGFMTDYCSVLDCKEPHKIGGHVQIAGSSNIHGYLIPLCHLHNRAYGHTFDIYNTIELVPADISNTCGYNPPLTF